MGRRRYTETQFRDAVADPTVTTIAELLGRTRVNTTRLRQPNNHLGNLRVICPNCHALTPTYRGRNIGRPTDPA